MTTLRRHCKLGVASLLIFGFYGGIKWFILTSIITSPVLDVDVAVTRQPATAAGSTVTSVDCSSQPIRLPEYVLTRCGYQCANITCDFMVNGGAPPAPRRTAVNTPPVNDSELHNVLTDCSTFQHSRRFSRVTSTADDDFPLAFNILGHRDADQLARLLRAIYRPRNVYCIHVDAKSPREFLSAVFSLVDCFDNVHVASKLESIVYAGFSRLQADITCMRDNLNSRVEWRYLINTAAQAFPLKTVEEMVNILRLYNGSNDIEGIYGHRILRSRFQNEWKEEVKKRKLVKTGNKNPLPPHDIDIVRGSAYGIFSREFVRFILYDKRARDLLQWSRSTWSPDEHYWATLHHTYSNPHLHTPGAFSGYPSAKPWLAVYANWGETKCHGRYMHGVCVFGLGDLPNLVRRREFFANKFDQHVDSLAYDCIDAWLQHRELCPSQLDYQFYSTLPFIYKH